MADREREKEIEHPLGVRGVFYQITTDVDDRQNALLTKSDREYLLGDKDVSEGYENQIRQRVRDRVRAGMLDFELLIHTMDNRDINTVFNSLITPQSLEEGVAHEAEYALAYIYHGVAEHTQVNFSRVLEHAIERAGVRSQRSPDRPHPQTRTASVEIDTDWVPAGVDLEHAQEKLRNGEEVSGKEIGALVRYGDLDDDDWEQLQEVNRAE